MCGTPDYSALAEAGRRLLEVSTLVIAAILIRQMCRRSARSAETLEESRAAQNREEPLRLGQQALLPGTGQ